MIAYAENKGFFDLENEVTVRDYFASQVLINLMTHNNKLSTTLKHDDFIKRISLSRNST